jgi:hypothetical protein
LLDGRGHITSLSLGVGQVLPGLFHDSQILPFPGKRVGRKKRRKVVRKWEWERERYTSGDAANVKHGAGRVGTAGVGGGGCYFPGGLIPSKYNLLFTGMVPIYHAGTGTQVYNGTVGTFYEWRMLINKC